MNPTREAQVRVRVVVWFLSKDVPDEFQSTSLTLSLSLSMLALSTGWFFSANFILPFYLQYSS